MKRLEDQLSMYAMYHRDIRNIWTHFVGVPMIVLAVVTLLSRPQIEIHELIVTPAEALLLLVGIYYIFLNVKLGIAMTALLSLAVLAAEQIAMLPTSQWLAWGVCLFVVGWIIQFIGHYWEGKKPAFFDDIRGLLIGPLFVVVEACFLMGFLQSLQATIVLRAGEVANKSAQNEAGTD
jgi:uncharacterized membrane protein YGL010W